MWKSSMVFISNSNYKDIITNNIDLELVDKEHRNVRPYEDQTTQKDFKESAALVLRDSDGNSLGPYSFHTFLMSISLTEWWKRGIWRPRGEWKVYYSSLDPYKINASIRMLAVLDTSIEDVINIELAIWSCSA